MLQMNIYKMDCKDFLLGNSRGYIGMAFIGNHLELIMEEYSFKVLRLVQELNQFHRCVYNTGREIQCYT